MSIKKTDKETSKKKIEANRRNAKKSSGPKSDRGKGNSRMNGLKHGILSNKITETLNISEEDTITFQSLVQGLVKSLKPANELEEMLVDLVATRYWRLQRILEIENATAEQAILDANNKLTGRDHTNRKFASWEEVPASHLLFISKQANLLITDVKEHGKISRADFSQLRRLFHAVDDDAEELGDDGKGIAGNFKDRLNRLFPETRAPSISQLAERAFIKIAKKDRKQLIELLAGIRDGMEETGLIKHSRELMESTFSVRLASVEMTEKSSLQIRYETSLENGIYKSLHELQRVQAFRLGRSAQVPVALDIQSPDISD